MAVNPIPSSFAERLDQDYLDFHDAGLAFRPAWSELPLADMRKYPLKYAAPWSHDYTFLPYVKDIQIPTSDGQQITARCYHPDPRISPFGEGPYPVHVSYHGGGYVVGDLTTEADKAMLIRNRVGILVVDVCYRHCPEVPFVRGHDDAWEALQWIHKNAASLNARSDSISIGGTSAGGHISAALQQLAHTHGLGLKLAVLRVPSVIDLTKREKPEVSPYESARQNFDAPGLPEASIQYFIAQCTPKNEEEQKDHDSRPAGFVAPIEGDVNGVCPTYVGVAECDPLRDEGLAYAHKLIDAGVRTTVRRFSGVPHTFPIYHRLKKTQMLDDDICSELKRAHED